MDNKLILKKILLIALKNEQPTTVSEIIKETSIKILGSKVVDLYIFTNKKFAEKILIKNAVEIKRALDIVENKKIKNIYINNKILDHLNLSELVGKKNIDTINLENFAKNKTNETSWEGQVENSIFSYETFVLNKKRVVLKFYNKFLKKEYEKEISTSIIKGKIYFLKRQKLIKMIKSLLELSYVPLDSDTKEIINLLKID